MSEKDESDASVLRSPRFPSSKFSTPKLVPGFVRRPRLLDELDRGRRARLTVVVASPGSGKTGLLADWLAARPQRPSAWLSCDVADADPVRFVAAIIEALGRAWGQPDIGEDARQLLSLEGQVSADVIAALADDLEGADGAGVLVVDDFHLTDGAGAGPWRYCWSTGHRRCSSSWPPVPTRRSGSTECEPITSWSSSVTRTWPCQPRRPRRSSLGSAYG